MFQGVLHVKSILNWFWLFLEGLFCFKFVYNQNILHYFMLVKHIIKITKQKAFYHTDRQTASEFSGLWADWIVGKKSMGHGPPAVSSGKLEISAKREDKKGEECREETNKICVERWNRRSGQERDELIGQERDELIGQERDELIRKERVWSVSRILHWSIEAVAYFNTVQTWNSKGFYISSVKPKTNICQEKESDYKFHHYSLPLTHKHTHIHKYTEAYTLSSNCLKTLYNL